MADDFAEKYEGKVDEFIEKEKHSLERFTNMHLFFLISVKRTKEKRTGCRKIYCISPIRLQVVKEKCDMCNRKTENRFRNY